MYKQLVIGMICTLFASSIFSCKSSKTSNPKVSATSLVINGDLADYIQVVDNKYEIASNYGSALAIKVKVVKPLDSYKLSNKNIKLSATLFDKDGSPLSGVEAFTYTDYDTVSELRKLLIKGTGEIVISLTTSIIGYNEEKDNDRAKEFTMSSSIVEKPKEVAQSTSNSNDISANPNVSSNNHDDNISLSTQKDNDQALDELEKCVNDYCVIIDEMNNKANIATIGTAYIRLAQHMTKLDGNIKEAQASLTIAQLSRLAELELKMARVIAENPINQK